MARKTALLIDFGSTYTKVTVADLQDELILASAQSLTTVETDINEGLQGALTQLREAGIRGPFQHKLACSSAAGGLKMVAVGLVPDLTAEGAKRAALGAGARVLGVFSRSLTEEEVSEISSLDPDIILLAGGTDGGNKEVVLHNARLLAQGVGRAPLIYAGNKSAAREATAILKAGGKEVRVTENILPELNRLNIEPARRIIRELFLEQIIRAKGLDRAEVFVDGILMPTPAAVLRAAEVLARGSTGEPGLGDLIIVDVGGATTDVHSMAEGLPTKAGVVLKGLPEPYAKRTVEGDLGMRCSAPALLEAALKRDNAARDYGGLAGDKEVARQVQNLADNPAKIPETIYEKEMETALAKAAVEIAVNRHCGSLEIVYTPLGASWVQTGKDLTEVRNLIGTGGVLVHHPRAREVLESALYREDNLTILKPKNPTIYLDKNYSLAAMGLLSKVCPDAALRITKKYLHRL